MRILLFRLIRVLRDVRSQGDKQQFNCQQRFVKITFLQNPYEVSEPDIHILRHMRMPFTDAEL